MAGLLGNDFAPDPLGQGLLGLGAALMTPRQLGGGIGPGLLAFNQQAQAAQMMRRQMEQDAMQRKLFDLKLGEAAESAEDRKRRRQMETTLQEAARRAVRPAAPGVGDENNPYVPAPDTPASFDGNRFFNEIAQVAPLEAMRLRKEMLGDTKPVVVDGALVTPDGRVVYQSPDKGQVVSPGSTLVRGNQPVYTAPDRPAAQPEIIRLMQARDALPPNDPQRAVLDDVIAKARRDRPLVNVSYGAPFAGVDPATGEARLYQSNNRGEAPKSTGLAPMPKPAEQPAENERVAAGYAGRMLAAEQIMQRVGEAGYPSLMRETIAEMPLTGGRLAPVARTQDQQLFRQAQEDWVRAKLRKESGAVIGEEEMAREIKTYFPQPLEPPALTAQKAQARQQAIAGMRGSAGRAPIPQADGAVPQSFQMLPNAAEHPGKTVRDTVSGKRYKSVNDRWVEVK